MYMYICIYVYPYIITHIGAEGRVCWASRSLCSPAVLWGRRHLLLRRYFFGGMLFVYMYTKRRIIGSCVAEYIYSCSCCAVLQCWKCYLLLPGCMFWREIRGPFAVCCSVLQCAAVCCSVFQVVVVFWRVLQCLRLCGSVLQCAAVCCSVFQVIVVFWRVLQCVAIVWQCVAVCCSVLQCLAVCCSVLQCVAVCCNVWQYVALFCSVW